MLFIKLKGEPPMHHDCYCYIDKPLKFATGVMLQIECIYIVSFMYYFIIYKK